MNTLTDFLKKNLRHLSWLPPDTLGCCGWARSRGSEMLAVTVLSTRLCRPETGSELVPAGKEHEAQDLTPSPASPQCVAEAGLRRKPRVEPWSPGDSGRKGAQWWWGGEGCWLRDGRAQQGVCLERPVWQGLVGPHQMHLILQVGVREAEKEQWRLFRKPWPK